MQASNSLKLLNLRKSFCIIKCCFQSRYLRFLRKINDYNYTAILAGNYESESRGSERRDYSK